MSQERLTKLLECVRRFGLKCGLDDDGITTAQGLSWWRDRRDDSKHPVSLVARYAVLSTLSGQDIPRYRSMANDPVHLARHRVNLGLLADRNPSPAEMVIAREAYSRAVER